MGEENLQNCAFPLGLHHPAGGGPSHGRRQHAQKFGKDRAWGSGDLLADALIAILRHCYCGQSKYIKDTTLTAWIMCHKIVCTNLS